MVWEKSESWSSRVEIFLSLQTFVYLVVVVNLAPHRTVNQSQKPSLLTIPGFFESSHFYLFDSAKMSVTPAPAAVPALLERVASAVRDHMATIPSGGVAGEEEYHMWGQDFVKRMVRFVISSMIVFHH